MPTLEKQNTATAVYEQVDVLKALQAQTQAELDALLPSVFLRSRVSGGVVAILSVVELRNKPALSTSAKMMTS